jgi:excinuclease ABC subunit A
LLTRVSALTGLGLGYLALDRSTPTLSSGELQRLRLATQLGSQLFGVIYVLDEPSAGLHPADSEALFAALQQLKASGNSLFVVEHDLETMRRADWLIDVGPAAGEHGGRVLYSGPPEGLAHIQASKTRLHLFAAHSPLRTQRRAPTGWLQLEGITRNNLDHLAAQFPLGCFTSVTGISGSGKSSLVSQALLELVGAQLGRPAAPSDQEEPSLEDDAPQVTGGELQVAWKRSNAWCKSIRNPLAVHRAPTLRPTPACSTTCANCSRPQTLRKKRVTTPDNSPSTSPRAAAPCAKAKASSAWNCCSCPASTRPARRAMAPVTIRKPWRSHGRA